MVCEPLLPALRVGDVLRLGVTIPIHNAMNINVLLGLILCAQLAQFSASSFEKTQIAAASTYHIAEKSHSGGLNRQSGYLELEQLQSEIEWDGLRVDTAYTNFKANSILPAAFVGVESFFCCDQATPAWFTADSDGPRNSSSTTLYSSRIGGQTASMCHESCENPERLLHLNLFDNVSVSATGMKLHESLPNIST